MCQAVAVVASIIEVVLKRCIPFAKLNIILRYKHITSFILRLPYSFLSCELFSNVPDMPSNTANMNKVDNDVVWHDVSAKVVDHEILGIKYIMLSHTDISDKV